MQYLHDIHRATINAFPNEMCGIVTLEDNFIELSNVSETPTVAFELDPFEFYSCRDSIAAIVHSHTQQKYLHICTPSVKDMETQKKWGFPFLIAGFDGITYTPPFEFPAKRNQDYIDRPYIYGINDCGTLVQDYYKFTFAIDIAIDPLLSLTPKKDWNKSIKLLLEANNFQEVATPKKGDLLLVNLFGGFNNHVVIYIDEILILNQNEHSQYEYFDKYAGKFNKIYRHESLC